MRNETFRAHTQYGDLKGTVSADDADMDSLGKYLRDNSLMSQDETLKGAEFYSMEHGIDVYAYIEDSNKQMSRIELPLSMEEFFSKFKRFSITLSPKGDLEGEEIQFITK